MTSSWFFLSTLNYDARSTTHQFIINFCLNMFRASLCASSGVLRPCVTAYGVLRWFCWHCSHPTTQRPTTATNHIQQNQRSTPYAVTHGLRSPEDGHNDARNMLRQKLIINIWSLRLAGFSLFIPATHTFRLPLGTLHWSFQHSTHSRSRDDWEITS